MLCNVASEDTCGPADIANLMWGQPGLRIREEALRAALSRTRGIITDTQQFAFDTMSGTHICDPIRRYVMYVNAA
eukprot:3923954-Rhodomonas_salina.2